MGFFHDYPYTDFHEINLDWILHQIMKLHKDYDEFKALNTITFSGEWNITKQYPAWTIVNVNGTEGYISIQAVPAGINYDNTDYWVLIVDYTVQLADLQNRVVALENDMDDVQDDIADLAALQDWKSRKVVFLGDSYNYWGGGWLTQVVNGLGLTNYYDFTVSGHGFSDNEWRSDLEAFTIQYPSVKDEITDIIIVGGVNDAESTALAALDTNCAAFFTFASANMPQAKVRMCYVGNVTPTSTYIGSFSYANRIQVQNIEGLSFAQHGAYYYKGCENCLNAYSYFQSDGLHPNNYGCRQIARAVISCLLTGVYENAYYFSDGHFMDENFGGRSVLRLKSLQPSYSLSVIDGTWRDYAAVPSGVSMEYYEQIHTTLLAGNGSTGENIQVFLQVIPGKVQIKSGQLATASSYKTFDVSGYSLKIIPDALFMEPVQRMA